jgi:hypothetical protein
MPTNFYTTVMNKIEMETDKDLRKDNILKEMILYDFNDHNYPYDLDYKLHMWIYYSRHIDKDNDGNDDHSSIANDVSNIRIRYNSSL